MRDRTAGARRDPRAFAVVVALVAGVSAASPASAAFTETVAASQQLGTATLGPPGSPSAALATCTPWEHDSVQVSWTAPEALWADGYHVLRAQAADGPYATVATVTGRGVTSHLDPALAFDTTYHYVVRATKQSWTSAATTPVAVTTRTPAC